MRAWILNLLHRHACFRHSFNNGHVCVQHIHTYHVISEPVGDPMLCWQHAGQCKACWFIRELLGGADRVFALYLFDFGQGLLDPGNRCVRSPAKIMAAKAGGKKAIDMLPLAFRTRHEKLSLWSESLYTSLPPIQLQRNTFTPFPQTRPAPNQPLLLFLLKSKPARASIFMAQ